jgi:uncharacterized protein (DUF1778 family)
MTKKAYDKIAAALTEALAVMRGEGQPAKVYVLSPEEWDAFAAQLEAPQEPTDALKRLRRRKLEWDD